MKKMLIVAMLTSLTLISGSILSAPVAGADTGTLFWLNHLDLLAGDPSVQTAFNAVDSGIGGGLSGLRIQSTTIGEDAQGGGSKVVEMGVAVPPWHLVTGVRVCYELTSTGSYLSQTRLAQLQNPPASALVLLDDDANLTDPGPVCVNSASVASPYINPANGGLRLSFRVNFGSINDAILIRGVALTLVPDPASPLQQQIDHLEEALETHTHQYLTGKGVGHNNTKAVTTPPLSADTPPLLPAKTVPKKK